MTKSSLMMVVWLLVIMRPTKFKLETKGTWSWSQVSCIETT